MTSSTQKHVEPPHAFLRNIVVTTVQRSSGNQGKHWISLRFSQITITALYIQAVFNVCLFAIKIQFLLLRLKIYNSKSQMYLRAAGAWIQNTNIALSVWRLLNVLDNKGRDILMCVCVRVRVRVCTYACLKEGMGDRPMCTKLRPVMYKSQFVRIKLAIYELIYVYEV